MDYNISLRKSVEMNLPIHSYDLWKKNLPSKLNIRQAEKVFHHTEKKLVDMLFA